VKAIGYRSRVGRSTSIIVAGLIVALGCVSSDTSDDPCSNCRATCPDGSGFPYECKWETCFDICNGNCNTAVCTACNSTDGWCYTPGQAACVQAGWECRPWSCGTDAVQRPEDCSGHAYGLGTPAVCCQKMAVVDAGNPASDAGGDGAASDSGGDDVTNDTGAEDAREWDVPEAAAVDAALGID
jgi:hypothetical protein